MQKNIAQNHLRMQNDGSECVYRTLITPEINYLGFGMHIDRFGTIFEIQKIGLKNGLCAESEWKCLGVSRNNFKLLFPFLCENMNDNQLLFLVSG